MFFFEVKLSCFDSTSEIEDFLNDVKKFLQEKLQGFNITSVDVKYLRELNVRTLIIEFSLIKRIGMISDFMRYVHIHEFVKDLSKLITKYFPDKFITIDLFLKIPITQHYTISHGEFYSESFTSSRPMDITLVIELKIHEK